MPTSLREFIDRVERARRQLGKIRKPQLHSATDRRGLISIVEEYFNSVRPSVLSQSPIDLKEIDLSFQDFLVLCHKRGSLKSYTSALKNIRKQLIAADVSRVSVDSVVANANDPIDQEIVSTLESLIPSAAFSYSQALADLQASARLSWRGPATDLREALRETLDHLAPDKEVTAMTGYKQELNTRGPTMKQKVRYILRNRGLGKNQIDPAENATAEVDEAIGSFVRSVYARSSTSTHTPTDKAEVARIRDYVRVVLCELLEIHR